MSTIEFKYTKGAVNRAGNILLAPDSEGQIEAKDVLDNWRSCHVSPLNSFQRSLILKLNKVDENALVSQRLKRTPSILSKLERNPRHEISSNARYRRNSSCSE